MRAVLDRRSPRASRRGRRSTSSRRRRSAGRSAQWIDRRCPGPSVPAPIVDVSRCRRAGRAPNQMLRVVADADVADERPRWAAEPHVARRWWGETPSSSMSRAALDDTRGRDYTLSVRQSSVTRARRRPMTAPSVEELAPRTEDEVREHLAAGQARRGPAAHVARVPEGDPAHPHGVGRHRARQRARLPARRRSTRRRSTTSARRSRSSRTSSPTPTSATGCSATSAST